MRNEPAVLAPPVVTGLVDGQRRHDRVDQRRGGRQLLPRLPGGLPTPFLRIRLIELLEGGHATSRRRRRASVCCLLLLRVLLLLRTWGVDGEPMRGRWGVDAGFDGGPDGGVTQAITLELLVI